MFDISDIDNYTECQNKQLCVEVDENDSKGILRSCVYMSPKVEKVGPRDVGERKSKRPPEEVKKLLTPVAGEGIFPDFRNIRFEQPMQGIFVFFIPICGCGRKTL